MTFMTKELTLTEDDIELLRDELKVYIINTSIEKALDKAVLKDDFFHVTMSDDDLRDLIGHACFVANHTEDDEDLELELDELIQYFEGILAAKL
jgi:hypothetical protein